MTVQQMINLAIVLAAIGLPVLAKLFQKGMEMREKQRQAAEAEERRMHALRTGQDLDQVDASRQWSQQTEESPSPRAQRASIADELARRRQQALEELRKRQRGGHSQSQASTAGQASSGQPMSRSPASARRPGRSSAPQGPPRGGQMPTARPQPLPTSRTRSADQQMSRRTTQRPREEREAQAMRQARERIADGPTEVDTGELRGLNVQLDSIDPHYVRRKQRIGIDPLPIDARAIRQALVMAELLGPPLALRDPDNATLNGPLGFSS